MPSYPRGAGRASGPDATTTAVVVATAALVVVYLATGDPTHRAVVGMLSIGLSVAGLAWAWSVAAPRRRPTAVALLVGMVLIGVGEWLTLRSAVDGTIAYPHPAEGFVAAGTVMLLLALLLTVGGGTRVSTQERRDMAIGAVCMTLFVLLSGVFTPGGSSQGVLVAAAFVAFACAMAATNVLVVSRPYSARLGGWTLLACLSLLAGDVGFYADVRDGFAEQGRATDAGYVLARGAIVAMAFAMRPARLDRPLRHTVGRQRVILAGAFALLVPVGALVGEATGLDTPASLTLLAGCVPVALLTWRAVMSVDELAAVADRDHLTGLANRRRLMAALEHECRSPGRFVLLVCDLDGFKQVNDRSGHAAGDRVLVTTADALRDAVPPGATVARLGGDEFAVLLPGAVDVDAARDSLETAVGPRLRQTHDVGVSTGGAHGAPGDRPDDVMAAADRAMYAHKQAAR